MSGPFDSLAPHYTALWTETPGGRSQRQQVRDEIDGIFRPFSMGGGKVLDLGCGVGDDALHLAALGVKVDAVDASERMVEIAKSRGVAARVLRIEDLASLEEVYAGALSNFGALNCVPDLRVVARSLSDHLEASAPLALCVMGRFCWRETLRSMAALDFVRAVRRWGGRAQWRGIQVRYWSAREIRAAFNPYFDLIRGASIGNGDHQLYILRRRNPC
jgi:2-polyprenyl-3-methyl-5-hydroxy-6-metoxy-1,4-benzoquinol methylase